MMSPPWRRADGAGLIHQGGKQACPGWWANDGGRLF